MEQVAFNSYFQTVKKPILSEKYIHHYWSFKEFRLIVKSFFDYNTCTDFYQIVIESDKINPEYLSAEKRTYKMMTFWQKQI